MYFLPAWFHLITSMPRKTRMSSTDHPSAMISISWSASYHHTWFKQVLSLSRSLTFFKHHSSSFPSAETRGYAEFQWIFPGLPVRTKSWNPLVNFGSCLGEYNNNNQNSSFYAFQIQCWRGNRLPEPWLYCSVPPEMGTLPDDSVMGCTYPCCCLYCGTSLWQSGDKQITRKIRMIFVARSRPCAPLSPVSGSCLQNAHATSCALFKGRERVTLTAVARSPA